MEKDTSTAVESTKAISYVLTDLNEMEMRLLFNGLKLQVGDFACYKGSDMWKNECQELKQKFPRELQW